MKLSRLIEELNGARDEVIKDNLKNVVLNLRFFEVNIFRNPILGDTTFIISKPFSSEFVIICVLDEESIEEALMNKKADLLYLGVVE